MAETEVEYEESFETTTVRRKTIKKSIKIEEVSNPKTFHLAISATSAAHWKIPSTNNDCDPHGVHYRFAKTSIAMYSRVVVFVHIYKEVCWKSKTASAG